ncbi:hypothetical protein Tco_1132658 [Tanacetum coccineum]|uniref:Uncharacterized protein n=1 Tax=Tanacetum coccineum TaxID=301880 RepID=A0ABQ5JFC0_9ASTR
MVVFRVKDRVVLMGWYSSGGDGLMVRRSVPVDVPNSSIILKKSGNRTVFSDEVEDDEDYRHDGHDSTSSGPSNVTLAADNHTESDKTLINVRFHTILLRMYDTKYELLLDDDHEYERSITWLGYLFGCGVFIVEWMKNFSNENDLSNNVEEDLWERDE